MYRLSDVDIRLLRVFRAVVECRGFTNAQAILNVGQSTISGHVANLEERLGMRLCDRGRAGFQLTSKGQRVYDEIIQLFKAHEQFENVTLELKGKLSGYLNVGVIDSIVTDPNCPIVNALGIFSERSNEVIIRLEIMTPDDLIRAVLDSDIDVAIGTFDEQVSGLNYDLIYVEHNNLYCGRSHPIMLIEDRKGIRDAVRTARKVMRTYLEGKDLYPLGQDDGIAHAQVRYLEATLILILGGGHIGFLPTHYADRWVATREMHPILPGEYEYQSEFYIVTHKTPRRSSILDTFLHDLQSVVVGRNTSPSDAGDHGESKGIGRKIPIAIPHAKSSTGATVPSRTWQ